MSDLQIFNFQTQPVRMQVTEQGEQLWCLKDVCKALTIKSYRQVVNRLDTPGVYKIDTGVETGKKADGEAATQQIEMLFITEPNLYRVIFQSDKPQAKAFQDWVFGEVLPSIRLTGSYTLESIKKLEGSRKYYKQERTRYKDLYQKERSKHWQTTRDLEAALKAVQRPPTITLPLLIERVGYVAKRKGTIAYEIWCNIYGYLKNYHHFNVFEHKETFGSCQKALDHCGYLDQAYEWLHSHYGYYLGKA